MNVWTIDSDGDAIEIDGEEARKCGYRMFQTRKGALMAIYEFRKEQMAKDQERLAEAWNKYAQAKEIQ
jgi:hypothetical protein